MNSDLNCKENEVYNLRYDELDHCSFGIVCVQYPHYGCHCMSGFKRHQGICIPINDCPRKWQFNNFFYSILCWTFSKASLECPGPYEILKADGNPCMDYCNKDVVKCAEVHEPGCYCMEGYARDVEKGVCRPFPCEDCGENAEWAVCTGPCDNRCDFVLGHETCQIENIKCPDACRCKEGYARESDDKSKCIPIENCKSSSKERS